METYLPMVKDALGMFLFLGVELSVLFIVISAAVSLLQQYIPDSKIQKLLGASKGRGYVLAAGLGAITPFCTCSTIPMLRGLLRAKAGFGPTLTFLFASPLLNPIIIGLFVATFGLQVTIIYTTFALLISIIAGVLLKVMGYERYIRQEGLQGSTSASCCGSTPKASQASPEAQTSQECKACGASCSEPTQESTQSCCSAASTSSADSVSPFSAPDSCCTPPQKQSSACCGEEPKPATQESSCCGVEPISTLKPMSACCAPQETSSCCEPKSAAQNASCCGAEPKPAGNTFKEKVRWALQDGYTQFKAVLPYLLLGVTLGSVIYGFVPSDFIANYASGDSPWAVPVAAVIGIPLYVRVEALIPLSAVLVGKGMGLGAVMALIIGGGGASLTEVILLKSLFKWPMVIAFLVVVLTMAVGAGYFFQFAY